jgi:hypothetical protein
MLMEKLDSMLKLKELAMLTTHTVLLSVDTNLL